jgi:AraC family transcriptional regulator
MSLRLSFGKFIGQTRKETNAQGFTFVEVLDRSDEEVPRHTHEDSHFCFILDGAYITSARNVDKICSPATLLFNPEGTTHQDRFYSRGGRFFTVSISAENLNRVRDGIDLIDHATGLSDFEATWLATRLYRESRIPDQFSPLIMEGMAIELLGHSARKLKSPAISRPRWLEMAHELIHDCCTENLSVKEIARIVGVHPFHLTRTFRKYYGCSTAEYLRSCRLKTAAALLRDSLFPLADIALECGFSDQSQFTKSFKKGTGMTPGEFRETFRK